MPPILHFQFLQHLISRRFIDHLAGNRTEPMLIQGYEPASVVGSTRKMIAAAGFGDHNGYLSRADREDAIHNPERHFLCVQLDWASS